MHRSQSAPTIFKDLKSNPNALFDWLKAGADKFVTLPPSSSPQPQPQQFLLQQQQQQIFNNNNIPLSSHTDIFEKYINNNNNNNNENANDDDDDDHDDDNNNNNVGITTTTTTTTWSPSSDSPGIEIAPKIRMASSSSSSSGVEEYDNNNNNNNNKFYNNNNENDNNNNDKPPTSILNSWLFGRTHLCQHRHSCAENTIYRGIVRTFGIAYILHSSWMTVISIVRNRKFKHSMNWSEIFAKVYQSADSIKFAQCMTLMSFLYKFALCFVFRRVIHPIVTWLEKYTSSSSSSSSSSFSSSSSSRQASPLLSLPKSNTMISLCTKNVLYHALSGFLSTFISSFLFIPHKYLKTIALYCMVRCLADLLRVLRIFNQIIEIPHMSSILFTCAQIPIMHAFLNEPDKMNPKFYAWILGMGNLFQIQARVFQALFKYDDYMPFLNCSPTFHTEYSCIQSHFLDWLHCLFRAGKMYLPVHFLPILLLSPKKFFKRPGTYIWKKSLSTLQSSIFLSTYQFNMKLTECWGRWLLQRDPPWLSMIGGFNSGLSILLEKKERRSELALYVIPQALEILMRHTKPTSNIGQLLRHPKLPIYVFGLAMGIWMGLREVEFVQYDEESTTTDTSKKIQPSSEESESKKLIVVRARSHCSHIDMNILNVLFGRHH